MFELGFDYWRSGKELELMEKKLEFPKQNSRFLQETYKRALIPGILSLLGGNLTVLADGVIVGRCIGSAGLSAVNLCLPLYLIICVFGSWIVAGTAIRAACELGAGSQIEGNRYCSISQALCLIASIVLTVLGFIFIHPMVRILCSDEQLYPIVYDYAWTTILSVAPKIAIYIPFWYLRLDGKNRSITIMMAILGLGNTILDLWFIMGLDMGVLGAGLASFVANVVAVLYGMYCLFYHKKNFSLGVMMPRGFQQFVQIMAAGSPSAMNNLFQAFRILIINHMIMSHYGSLMVAVFTAVNGVASFAECILVGVPQAATAMLGSFAGDHDRNSIQLLMRNQIKIGIMLDVAFGLLIVLGEQMISSAYGLDNSMLVPMLCLAVSLIPALICTIIIGYYNTIGKNRFASVIVFARVFLFPSISLIWLIKVDKPIWIFFPMGEVFTILIYFLCRKILFYKNSKSKEKFQQIEDDAQETISSSVEGSSEQICKLSEGLYEFCTDKGMSAKMNMKLSLAIEELLVLISEENAGSILFCDLRLRVRGESAVMTLRYSGHDYNPLEDEDEDDERLLGLHMLEKLVRNKEYQNISGMNVLRISI